MGHAGFLGTCGNRCVAVTVTRALGVLGLVGERFRFCVVCTSTVPHGWEGTAPHGNGGHSQGATLGGGDGSGCRGAAHWSEQSAGRGCAGFLGSQQWAWGWVGARCVCVGGGRAGRVPGRRTGCPLAVLGSPRAGPWTAPRIRGSEPVLLSPGTASCCPSLSQSPRLTTGLLVLAEARAASLRAQRVLGAGRTAMRREERPSPQPRPGLHRPPHWGSELGRRGGQDGVGGSPGGRNSRKGVKLGLGVPTCPEQGELGVSGRPGLDLGGRGVSH